MTNKTTTHQYLRHLDAVEVTNAPNKASHPQRRGTFNWEPAVVDGIDCRLWRRVYPLATAEDVKKSGGQWEKGDEMLPGGIPDVDPSYVLRAELVREIAYAVWPHDQGDPEPMVLSGAAGTGKTTLVEQIAARLRIPVYRVNLNVGTTVRHLKGRVGAVAGQGTVFVPGIATMAMEHHAWLLLDEISGVTPPVALALFPILEAKGRVLLEDAQPPRYIRRSEHFRVFGTDNTLGAHMETTRFSYAGTNPDMNAALLDRFTGGVVPVGYLSPAAEFKAIKAKVPGIDSETLEGMIIVANNIRESREITAGFSTRMLISWARRFQNGYVGSDGEQQTPTYDDDTWVLETATRAFLNKQKTMVEKDAMAEVIRRTFVIGAG